MADDECPPDVRLVAGSPLLKYLNIAFPRFGLRAGGEVSADMVAIALIQLCLDEQDRLYAAAALRANGVRMTYDENLLLKRDARTTVVRQVFGPDAGWTCIDEMYGVLAPTNYANTPQVKILSEILAVEPSE